MPLMKDGGNGFGIFDNRVLGRIFSGTWDEETVEYWMLHNDELE